MHAQLSVTQPENEMDSLPRNAGSMKKLISFNNIRVQLFEQLCIADVKLDTQSDLIDELCDFFRHRSQLELEHSKGLDKVLRCFQASHSDQTAKNSKPWPTQTSYACWNHLINETKSISHDYAVLSEIYNADLIFKLQKILQIYKKYRELVFEAHEEILRVLRNFQTTVRTYYIFLNEHKGVGTKSKSSDHRKAAQVGPRKEKQHGNKSEKEMDMNTIEKLEVLKSRYIYKHYVETSNVAIHKTMLRDMKDIINSMDLGFGLMVSKAILSHVSMDQKQYLYKLYSNKVATQPTDNSEQPAADSTLARKESVTEKQPTDDKNIQNILDFELELQMQLLRFREESLRKHQEKIYGVLDVTGKNYHEKVKVIGEDLEQELGTLSSSHSKAVPVKHKEDGRLYILANLSPVAKQISFKSCTSHKMKVESRIHIQRPWSHRPKLFGGSLEDYLKATKEPIPLIMRSCIRVINSFGLQSQGIFRVSGSQVEILNFRDCFERGEDPLAGATDASDMNSVAGVLKLYLRELHEPLFPSKYFDIFLSLIQKESKYEVVIGMRNFLKNISKPTLIVIRYLFAFLNHLSEHAGENMMDAFNLAVSFGPTLMPAPSDKKQVQYQTQLNELIKVLIVYYKEVFPKDLGGPEYEKFMSEDSSR